MMQLTKSKPTQQYSHSFSAIGTEWSIITNRELDKNIKDRISTCIESFDKTYSRFRKDSLVFNISNKPGTFAFPKNDLCLITFYKSLYDATSGQVTPLIGDALVRAGYDENYSFEPGAQAKLPSWDEAMEWEGSKLKTQVPMVLDFGAAGKGYLIDLIAKILDQNNIHDYVVDGSGDLRQKGTIENKVGLEHPLDATKVIGMIEIENKSLAASATNRRKWSQDMHHIFDPTTLQPVRNILATWAIADSAMIADGLSTALFFVEPEKLNIFEFSYVRLHSDLSLDYSPELEGKLF